METETELRNWKKPRLHAEIEWLTKKVKSLEEKDSYSGWANYETWCSMIWYRDTMDTLAMEGVTDAHGLVEQTMELIKSDCLGQTNLSGMASDLMSNAIARIDDRELLEVAEDSIDAAKDQD